MEIIQQVLSNEKVLNKSEKINLSLVDISKGIKQQLKIDFPKCKFSIRTEFYSMGSSLHIYIMETNFKLIKSFEDLSQVAILSYTQEGRRTTEDLKNLQNNKHHQISSIYSYENYNPNVWNNGIFLTEDGFNLVKRITEIINKFNYDDSDIQTDYFDVNFYTHLNIGKWDKPLIENI